MPTSPAISPTRPGPTARPSSRPSAARASRSFPTPRSRKLSIKFLEWFIKDDTQKKWAELGGYTCSAVGLESDEFRKATPYNEAFYQTMFIVKDFWAVPEYAELLTQINNHVYPYVVGGEGNAKMFSMRSSRTGPRRSRNTDAAANTISYPGEGSLLRVCCQ